MMRAPVWPTEYGTPYAAWLAQFRSVWHQGEHVALIGQTGSGKTYVASDILDIRDYVAVLAIKPRDDTLDRFKRRIPRYKRVTKWPPDFSINRALFHVKPEFLGDPQQGGRVAAVLNGAYKSGGWTLFLDDLAYVVNSLKLRAVVVDLMNVGRSNGNTLVGVLQQPTSISASVPSEMKKQTTHILVWKYTGKSEIEACADIMGMDKRELETLMSSLRYHDNGSQRYSDFIHYHRGYGPQIVRVH